MQVMVTNCTMLLFYITAEAAPGGVLDLTSELLLFLTYFLNLLNLLAAFHFSPKVAVKYASEMFQTKNFFYWKSYLIN